MDNPMSSGAPRLESGAMPISTASVLVTPAAVLMFGLPDAAGEFEEIEPLQLERSRAGRSLSRARYRRAEEFMLSLEPGAQGDRPEVLYTAGIVAQLVLSSHLLDVGFPDVWCARNIGLHVARSLAYANATGLGLDCPETARLAQVLSPYSKWNGLNLAGRTRPDDGGFTIEPIRARVRAMLDHVGDATGHRRHQIV